MRDLETLIPAIQNTHLLVVGDFLLDGSDIVLDLPAVVGAAVIMDRHFDITYGHKRVFLGTHKGCPYGVIPALALRAFICYRSFSAICTAFSAAPFLIWSPATQRLIPRLSPIDSSWRILPT